MLRDATFGAAPAIRGTAGECGGNASEREARAVRGRGAIRGGTATDKSEGAGAGKRCSAAARLSREEQRPGPGMDGGVRHRNGNVSQSAARPRLGTGPDWVAWARIGTAWLWRCVTGQWRSDRPRGDGSRMGSEGHGKFRVAELRLGCEQIGDALAGHSFAPIRRCSA